RREDQPALVVQARSVGAEKHRPTPSPPVADPPGAGRAGPAPPSGPTLLHFPPPSTRNDAGGSPALPEIAAIPAGRRGERSAAAGRRSPSGQRFGVPKKPGNPPVSLPAARRHAAGWSGVERFRGVRRPPPSLGTGEGGGGRYDSAGAARVRGHPRRRRAVPRRGPGRRLGDRRPAGPAGRPGPAR